MPLSKIFGLKPTSVLSIVLGGGQGTRLFPLTKERAKPAVPLAGKYRLVDIPISNCINSGMKRIYLLTQFNSASLHRHISQSFKFDPFTNGFVELLTAEQTYTDTSWYQGTADAVRKNKIHFLNQEFEYALILCGDQLYRMDLRYVLAQHIETNADLTVATKPVTRPEVPAFGIMQIDADRRITRFVEKPMEPAVQDSLMLPRDWYETLEIQSRDDLFLASMGIYLFKRDVLFELLENDLTDFGKHIIPKAIHSHRVFSFIFNDYWEDIGTIRAFFNANLELTMELPRFNFFDMMAPIFTRPRFLPASKINGADIDHTIIADGCVVNYATLHQTVLGLRSRVERGSHLERVIMLGSDFYESETSIRDKAAKGIPRIGIGNNTRIDNAIIDKNARIGSHCVISPQGKPDEVTDPRYYIRDGIVIIPKNGVVPDHTVI